MVNLLKTHRIYVLSSVLLALSLTHCTTAIKTPSTAAHAPQAKKNTQDGAPSGPIPYIFKRLLPVDEPFSHYGNPESYSVAGHKYHVLQTASGYKARGMASWYGTKFHSQRTSSGEKYNMYAMTAAHKTLPIPCYVRVKNLQNGKEITVKVNDRGPFHVDRVIDLSYAAAAQLGILPKGTARVEVSGIQAKGQKKQHIAHYYIQAAAFTQQTYANDLKNKINRITHSPAIIEHYGERYVVKAGPFMNKQACEKKQEKLIQNGIKGTFIVLR